MSSKQRRIKRKLNIIAKVYRQYVRAFYRSGADRAEPIFADHDHRSRTLYARLGQRANDRWTALCRAE